MCLWLGEDRGPNCACCLRIRRISAGDGGLYNVVGGSSIFALSAVAVDSDIVGRGTDAGLIEEEYCCGFSVAASKAAVAVCPSDFFGVNWKYDENRLFREVVSRWPPVLSLLVDWGVVEPVKGIVNRRGIFDSSFTKA